MAIALGDMPIIGGYDFGWVEEYVKSCQESEDNGGNQNPSTNSRPLLVDVAGGKGQALKVILQQFPLIPPERCVLEDQEQAIEEAILGNDQTLQSVMKVKCSIFEVQSVKGAGSN